MMDQCLYLTSVMHRREGDFPYRFSYPVFSLMLDIDQLEETAHASNLLRIGRSGLISFDPNDHGAREGTDLRGWAERKLAGAGVDIGGGRIFLLCFPRLFGYGFNPLSLWYCAHADGALHAVIAEVRNTFGETHSYVLHNEGRSMPWPVRAAASKVFHVSPFIGPHCEYHFRLSEPGRKLSVVIREFEDRQPRLPATQTGRAIPLNDRGLIRALLRTPFMTLKVMAAIHWHAFKLWLRGARFYSKPTTKHEVSLHGTD